MINLNANVNSVLGSSGISMPKVDGVGGKKPGFSDTVKAIEKHISKVDDLQQSANMTVKDLLTGKSGDINSVVAAAAKADISFKLLVGVRNKLIEAYKQTMNMQI